MYEPSGLGVSGCRPSFEAVSARRTYALPNAWALAAQRLELLEECHDPTTIRHADGLGVGPGWRCLDAGAGHGSFARWLATRVGETGSVLAVDLDVTLLEQIDTPGLEVRRLDLVADELPRDEFDLVHTRLVLLHIAERDEVLARLAAAVRPGGWLLVEEDDIFPIRANATGDYREAWEAFLETMQAGGTDGEWARGLPARLGGADLTDIAATVDVQIFPGGSPAARFWSLTWTQVRDRPGAHAAALDRGREALAEPSSWFYGPAKVIVAARRAST